MNIKSLLSLFACTLIAVVVPSASAFAADFGYVGTGSFGAAGSGSGEFVKPTDIAVQNTTGLIFVADSSNARVQVFEPSGAAATYLTQIAGSALDAPFGVAVDQSSGDLYVSDAGESRIYRFVSDGAPIPTYSVDPAFSSPKAGSADGRLGTFAVRMAVDPSSGDLLVADSTQKRVSRYDSSGTFVSSFTGGDAPDGGFTGPIDLAADAAGKVTVVDAAGDIAEGGGTSRALRFNADGTYDSSYAGVSTPGAVAIDPHTGYTLLAGQVGAFSGVRLHVYNNLTQVSNVALPGDNSGTLTGLAVDGGATENVYALGDSVFGCCGFVGVTVLSAAELPAVTISTSTAMTASSAHLQGTIDPNGSQTSWHFEISSDGGSNWTPVGADDDAGSGSSPVSVQGDATGLEPSTAYQVRLAAATTEGLAATSTVDSFSTLAVAPQVSTLPASAITTGAATLGGTIDPRHATTSYRIDYGTTTAYGSSVPSGGGSAGTERGTVSERLMGLQPDTTYHFRVVATNAGGTTAGADRSLRTASTSPAAEDTCPNAAIREAQHASNLPDCRAYEQVSPVDKSGGSVHLSPGVGWGITSASSAGDAMLYYSFAAFANATSLYQNSYHARRTSTGWTTESASPEVPENTAFFGVKGGGFGATSTDASAGLYQYIMGYPLNPLDQDKGNDVYSWRSGEGVSWDSRRNDDAVDARPIVNSESARLVGLSDDGERRFFQSLDLPFADTPGAPQEAGYQAYERHNGRTTPLGVNADGSALACGARIPEDPVKGPTVEQAIRAISADGRTVALISPAPNPFTSGHPPSCEEPTSILLRTPSGEAVDASASQRSSIDSPKPATFQWMSRDGRRVLFTSEARLTDDAPVGGGIYQFDLPSHTLAFRAASNQAATQVALAGVSNDGQRMYFLNTDTSGSRQMLAFVDGTLIRNVAEVTNIRIDDQVNALGVSDDGKVLVFNSVDRLTAYDNAGTGEVYRYDADDDSMACVSCPADGRPSTGSSRLIAAALSPPRVHNLSADGRRLFFESAEALVPGDVNGATDVYEYDHHTHRLSVLTHGSSESNYVDASVDGSTVFVITSNSLLADDVDGGGRDIYGIRTDGGFRTSASGATPACSGDACQGLPTSVTISPPSASAKSSGTESLGRRPKTTSKPKVRKPSESRSTSAAIKVTVAGKGKILVRGPGLVSVTRSVAKKATYSVKVRLSGAGERSLTKHGRLRVSTRVTYQPVNGKPATTAVTLLFVRPSRSVRGTTALSLDFRKGR